MKDKPLKAYQRAMSYYQNARKMLIVKGKLEHGRYRNTKPCKWACNNAFYGVLIALEQLLFQRGLLNHREMSKRILAEQIKKILKNTRDVELMDWYLDCYYLLHINGYSDGINHEVLLEVGFQSALSIIQLLGPRLAKEAI